MYSAATASKAVALLGILFYDTELETKHPELAAMVQEVLNQAVSEEEFLDQFLDTVELGMATPTKPNETSHDPV